MTRKTDTRRDNLLTLVRSVQNAYPQIYLACHLDHIRRRTRASPLSSGDASLLAHLSFDSTSTPTMLARHLGVAASSLSARVKQLEAQGYIKRSRTSGDRRVFRLELTQKGLAASSAASVLDSHRVAALLESLPENDRNLAVSGLALLAVAAAKTLRKKVPAGRKGTR